VLNHGNRPETEQNPAPPRASGDLLGNRFKHRAKPAQTAHLVRPARRPPRNAANMACGNTDTVMAQTGRVVPPRPRALARKYQRQPHRRMRHRRRIKHRRHNQNGCICMAHQLRPPPDLTRDARRHFWVWISTPTAAPHQIGAMPRELKRCKPRF